ALKMAFENSGLNHCGIGSVKTNIGHLDAAAGVTGLIKTVLAMKHRAIPPSLHFESPNPKIDFKNSSFYVVDKAKEWEGKKIAGVSSFGIGGTNAHVVVEEAPEMQPAASAKSAHLMVFSAKTGTSLDSWAKEFHPQGNLADIAYTLQNGRKDFKYRGFAVHSNDEAGETFSGEAYDHSNVFMFPGQGSQYVRMGFDLYRSEPLFREELKACFEIYDLEDLVYPADGRDTSEEIAQTAVTQPLLFMFEYALARTMMKLGVQPDMMIGHSIGEYVAACIAGVIDLEDAIKLVVKRGQLIQQLPKGSMLSVMMDENAIQPYLNARLSLAVVNSTGTCVVSGPSEEIAKLQERLLAENISNTLLKTSHAFHSFMMEPAMIEFRKSFTGIQLKSPKIPFISNVTGDFITGEDAVSSDYWVKQLRHTVRFAGGIERLMQKENIVFIEAGPGNSLSNFILKHTAKKDTHKLVNLVRNIRTVVKDDRYFYEALGKLWVLGTAIDFRPLYAGEARRKVSLPAYCYDRIQLDSPEEAVKQESKRPLAEWFYTPVWEKKPTATPFVNQQYFNEWQWIVFTQEHDLFIPADNVITVKKGETVDVSKLDDKPINIIYAWPLTQKGPLSIESCSTQMNENFYPLLDLIRAIGFRKVHLTILTNNSFNITGDDLHFPGNAAYAALVKVLPLEYKDLTCQLIDITEGVTISSILSQIGKERIIALRGLSQWLPSVKPVSLDSYTRNEPLLANEKVYVVLGLGGMGVYMAKYIAENFRSKVVIIHRNALPPKEEWSGQLAVKMNLLQDVKNIHLLQADITDLEAMTAAVHEIENAHGQVNGIIHAAGVIDKGGVLHRRSNQSIAETISSKVTGALIIETLFKNKDLDFFMLFSSLGNELFEEKYGELAYGIANEFLDAYAQCNSGIKNKICINWCDWQEVGMAMKAIDSLFNSDVTRQKEMEQFNAMAIHPREGVDAFARVCNSSLTRVMLYPFDLEKRLQQRDKTLLNYAEFLDKKFRLLTEITDTSFVQVVRSQSVEENVINVWKDYLGHKEISLHDNIFEIGASSLDVVQVKNIFKSQLSIDVPVTAFFEYPTIHAFIKFIKGGEEVAADASGRIDKGRNKLEKLKKLSNVKG
ncbi:MAG TPA: SDR family NAD(P)-dependent oxidoreductase, partial [Chitinophagaceae bacterium]|nr:SDR family NAD(P)-dependent oxidoreductase [Chitinophagaceae bacterium]